jgi:hypothetical protein
MLAVFVIWGLDTEGDAENPVFNLCWGRRKRVGKLLNLLIMKKLSFEKFSSKKVITESTKTVNGGLFPSFNFTAGGDYFFGYGNSTCDYNNGGGNCGYLFGDNRILQADCK